MSLINREKLCVNREKSAPKIHHFFIGSFSPFTSSWMDIANMPPIHVKIRPPCVSRYFCTSNRVRGCCKTHTHTHTHEPFFVNKSPRFRAFFLAMLLFRGHVAQFDLISDQSWPIWRGPDLFSPMSQTSFVSEQGPMDGTPSTNDVSSAMPKVSTLIHAGSAISILQYHMCCAHDGWTLTRWMMSSIGLSTLLTKDEQSSDLGRSQWATLSIV